MHGNIRASIRPRESKLEPFNIRDSPRGSSAMMAPDLIWFLPDAFSVLFSDSILQRIFPAPALDSPQCNALLIAMAGASGRKMQSNTEPHSISPFRLNCEQP